MGQDHGRRPLDRGVGMYADRNLENKYEHHEIQKSNVKPGEKAEIAQPVLAGSGEFGRSLQLRSQREFGEVWLLSDA